NPTKALQVLVSRVRSTTSAQVIERTATGYRLGLEPEEVDVLALADLETTAHTALARDDLISASAAARRALEIGPSPRTGRVLAISDSRAADHLAALALLVESVHEQPMDEELMACLLRSEAAVHGPAAALKRYETYRAALADNLGSDPGSALQAVHRELLAADRPVRQGVRYDGTPLLGRDGDIVALRTLVGSAPVVS